LGQNWNPKAYKLWHQILSETSEIGSEL